MGKNQEGFGAIEAILIVVIVAIIGFAGWFVYNSQKKTSATLDKTAQSQAEPQKASDKKPTISNNSSPSSEADKSKDIQNYDKASASLKTALLNNFYDQAKTDCVKANQGVSADAQISYVMTVQKMVRDDFATVQFCGSGGSSILAKVQSEWKNVGSIAMAPACPLVDQYKISKEITPTCYLDGGSSKDVTYP